MWNKIVALLIITTALPFTGQRVSWAAGAQRALNGSTTPAGFKVFISRSERYQIAYPNTWFLRTAASTQYFFGEVDQKLATTVNVNTVGANGASLPQTTNRLKSTLLRAGVRIDRIESTRIDGVEARTILAHLLKKKGGVRDRFETAVFIARGKVWQITLSSAPLVMGLNLAVFEKMLSSFRFR